MAKMLRCRDAGADCDFVARGDTVEEILMKAAEHGKKEHGLNDIPAELEEKMRALIREEAT
jgi:predicted small metal-binding protein